MQFMIVLIQEKGKHIHRLKYDQPAFGQIIWVQVQVRTAGHAWSILAFVPFGNL